MRVVSLAPIVLTAVVGFAPAAWACSVASSPGPISSVINQVTTLLGLTGGITETAGGSGGGDDSALASSNSGTTNNFITNNFFTTSASETTGDSTGTGATSTQGAGGAAGAAPAVAASTPGVGFSGGGFGGGGGGGGGIGGFFGSSTGIAGAPVNPSSDYVVQYKSGIGSGSSSGGGLFASPAVLPPGATGSTEGVAFAAAPQESDAPMTAGVTLASMPTAASDAEPISFGSASPMTDPSPSVGLSAFGLDTPFVSTTLPAAKNWTMLAAVMGIALVGAGWAWKLLKV